METKEWGDNWMKKSRVECVKLRPERVNMVLGEDVLMKQILSYRR